MAIEFTKYQGLGNDFILIDNRHQSEPLVTPAIAMQMCDRNFGIGADGVIFALPGTSDTDYTMRIFNSDSSEPQMCGNGIRCLAKFIADLEQRDGKINDDPSSLRYKINTLAGLIAPEILPDGQVKVDMGKPRLFAGEIPTTLAKADQKAVNVSLSIAEQSWLVTCVSMGNPHCITFVEDVAAIPLAEIGPQFEHHPVFPERTNTEFVQVIQPDYLKMRVWERGAGATLACGTGACAVVVAGVLTGNGDRSATVELPGGCLMIEWSADDDRLYMSGPAERVFTGQW